MEKTPMRNRLTALGLGLGLVAVLTAGCGGGFFSNFPSRGTFSAGGSGSLVLLGGDSPICDVVSLQLTITGATLAQGPGGGPFGSLGGPVVISSAQPVTVDFASLRDFVAFLNLSRVPAGTYGQITLTLSNPKLTVLDFSQSPPLPKTIPATLSTHTVQVALGTPLTVTNNVSAGLQLEFDLAKSVATDPQGRITGQITPTFTADPVIPSGAGSLADLEDLHGLVQSVSTTSSNPAFAGSLELQSSGGSLLTVNITKSSTFNGANGVGTQLVGVFVEVDAFIDSKGNIVANQVQVEDQDDPSLSTAGFVGLVTSASFLGSATQLNLVVREEAPDISASIPLESLMVVKIQPSTRFQVSGIGANPPQLQLSPANIGIGQQLVVHGRFQAGTGGVAPIVNANSIFLMLQSIVGNFNKLIIAGSDGKTGGFVFVPCSDIFQGQSLTALTFSGTAFAGVSDLNGLTKVPTLVVKGLLFFEPTLTSSGTVTLTPPSSVVVAKQVHQLQ